MPYMKQYRVRGRFWFPTDMLRYDSSIGRNADDKASIAARRHEYGEGFDQPREVELLAFASHRTPVPTMKRWESFGWQVVRQDKWEYVTHEVALSYGFDARVGRFRPDDVQFIRE